MHSSWKLCTLLIFLLATCIHEGLSIKCWVCKSALDPACADPFDNTTIPITDCDLISGLPHLPGVRSTMCRKIRQQVNGALTIIRGCAFLGEPGVNGNETACITPSTLGHKISIEYCSCNSTDGCNV